MLQVFLARREPQDPFAIAQRREAVRVSRARLRQGLLEFERSIQARADPSSRQAVQVQGSGLPEEVHGSEQSEKTREDVQALCGGTGEKGGGEEGGGGEAGGEDEGGVSVHKVGDVYPENNSQFDTNYVVHLLFSTHC